MFKKPKIIIFCIIFMLITGMYIFLGEEKARANIIDKIMFDIWKENVVPLVGKGYGRGEDYLRNLILVNYRNPIPEGYAAELEEVENGHKVDKRAAESLRRMLSDAREQGLSPVIVSSYRTNSKQDSLFKNQVSKQMNNGFTYEEAFEAARMVVAYPGTSEHQLGLAVDIVSRNYQVLDTRQEEMPETIWLMENCAKYGFVLRYPSGKSDITEIIYEPWHYRYVGERAAIEMTEMGLCLEEYIEWLNQSGEAGAEG